MHFWTWSAHSQIGTWMKFCEFCLQKSYFPLQKTCNKVRPVYLTWVFCITFAVKNHEKYMNTFLMGFVNVCDILCRKKNVCLNKIVNKVNDKHAKFCVCDKNRVRGNQKKIVTLLRLCHCLLLTYLMEVYCNMSFSKTRKCLCWGHLISTPLIFNTTFCLPSKAICANAGEFVCEAKLSVERGKKQYIFFYRDSYFHCRDKRPNFKLRIKMFRNFWSPNL